MTKNYLFSICFLLLFAGFGTGGPAFLKTAAARSMIQTKTTLRIQADFYFGDEDEEIEPVEADFYLLDASLIAILKKAKFKPVDPDGAARRENEEDYLEAVAKILLSQEISSRPDDEAELLAILINDAVERHQSSFTRTNQSGRGYFKAIRAGNYYLFGIKKIENQIVVWHLPVSVASGANSIELDQNNAALIFSAAE